MMGETPLYKFKRIKNSTFTPTDIYLRLTGEKKFLLESTFQHEEKGKYSFLGEDPYLEFIGTGNETTMMNHETGRSEKLLENALTAIKKQLPKIDANLPLPYYGGAIGFISYDTIRQYENIGEDLPDDIEMPDIHLMVFKNTIVVDHKNQVIYLIVMNPDNEPEERLNERLQKLQAVLMNPFQEKVPVMEPIQFSPNTTAEEFKRNVEVAKEYIRKGDIFQIVLSHRFTAELRQNPFHLYQRLREANPSPYMFFIDFEDYIVLGASPESLVQTKGRTIITNPIAGTRPRGNTEEEDARLVQELLADEKELAEHRMLVDLSRNDLGRVSEIGTIELPTYMKIEKYQHVMHIVSEVKGKLREEFTSIDALISCLPAGTVSGAPKIRAMQIINELENKKRGVYAGGIGFINFNFDMNIALAIRSLVVKDGKAHLQAGAGIVYDSDPETEYMETMNKAKSLMEVAGNVLID